MDDSTPLWNFSVIATIYVEDFLFFLFEREEENEKRG